MGNTYLCTSVGSKDQVIYLNRYNTVSNFFCYDKQLMLNVKQATMLFDIHVALQLIISTRNNTQYM